MSKETADFITLFILLLTWPVWLIWEIFVLVKRGIGLRFSTISMVARDRAAHISWVIYLWAGMASHWWWPGSHYAGVTGSIIFWLVPLYLLIQDILLWRTDETQWPTWLKWQKKPIILLAVGFVAGKLLFPQAG